MNKNSKYRGVGVSTENVKNDAGIVVCFKNGRRFYFGQDAQWEWTYFNGTYYLVVYTNDTVSMQALADTVMCVKTGGTFTDPYETWPAI